MNNFPTMRGWIVYLKSPKRFKSLWILSLLITVEVMKVNYFSASGGFPTHRLYHNQVWASKWTFVSFSDLSAFTFSSLNSTDCSAWSWTSFAVVLMLFYLLFPRVVSPSNSLELFSYSTQCHCENFLLYFQATLNFFTLLHNTARHSDFWTLWSQALRKLSRLLKVPNWVDRESRFSDTPRRSFSLKRLS